MSQRYHATEAIPLCPCTPRAIIALSALFEIRFYQIKKNLLDDSNPVRRAAACPRHPGGITEAYG